MTEASLPTPLVSIVTPSYNQAQFLEETLRSVANQDYPRIEHIVMDGGSTDGSVDLLAAWSNQHPILWRSGPDNGQAAAIQAGVAMATGEIVAWLNSDDVYLGPSAITEIVEAMRGGAAIVTGAGWYLFEDGSKERPIPVFPDRIDFKTLRLVDWVLQPATFVRRDLFLSCPIDTGLQFAFDWDLFIKLSQKATFTPLAREIAGYRRHQTGKTVAGGPQRQRELLEVVRRYNGRLSWPYLLLAPVVLGHRVAGHLPKRLAAFGELLLNRFAALTQKVTDGRGIPY